MPSTTAASQQTPEPNTITVTPGSPWAFDAAGRTLTHTPTGYYVDLDTCRTSAEMLDWIFQVAGKAGISTVDLGHLVRDLEALLTPQRTLCSWGTTKGPINVKAVLNKNRWLWLPRNRSQAKDLNSHRKRPQAVITAWKYLNS